MDFGWIFFWVVSLEELPGVFRWGKFSQSFVPDFMTLSLLQTGERLTFGWRLLTALHNLNWELKDRWDSLIRELLTLKGDDLGFV